MPKLLDEVVVQAGMVVGRLRRYNVIIDTLPVVDTLTKAFNKVFNMEPFKVYPNPAQKGSQVHVQIREAGRYAIQLLDGQSKLLSVKEATISNKEEMVQLALSFTLPSACYYLRVINTDTGKQSVSKLLMQ